MSFNETINLTGTVAPENKGSLVDVNEKLHETSEAIKRQGPTSGNVLRALALVEEMSGLVRENSFGNFEHKDFAKFEELDRVELRMTCLEQVDFLPPHYVVVSGVSQAVHVLDLTKMEDRSSIEDILVTKNTKRGDLSELVADERGKFDALIKLNSKAIVYLQDYTWYRKEKFSHNNRYPTPLRPRFMLNLENGKMLTNDTDGYQVLDFSSGIRETSMRSGFNIPDQELGQLTCGIRMKNGRVALGNESGELMIVDPHDKQALKWRSRITDDTDRYSVQNIVEYDDNKLLLIINEKNKPNSDNLVLSIDFNASAPDFVHKFQYRNTVMLGLGGGKIVFPTGWTLNFEDADKSLIINVISNKKDFVNDGPSNEHIVSMMRLPDGRIVAGRIDGTVVFYGEAREE